MTELIFERTAAGRVQSLPVEVTADFALHLTFDENVGKNHISVYRSVTGDDYALAFSTDWDASVFDETFTGVGGGLFVVVSTNEEPTLGAIS